MAPPVTAPDRASMRRRDLQKEQTRLDLALAAFDMAQAEGLAHVRVPQIAAAVGVSTRTFNNYFSSKEAAIVWPTTLRDGQLVSGFAQRPDGERLADALVAAVADLYGPAGHNGVPEGWLDGFRSLVAAEPALHGEYLKARASSERALADAVALRTGATPGDLLPLLPLLVAGVVFAAERAAVLYWFRQTDASTPLVEVVRSAVAMAVGSMDAGSLSLS